MDNTKPSAPIKVKPVRDTSPPRSGTVEEIDRYVGSPEETGIWGEWLTDVSDALDYAWNSLPTVNIWEDEKDKLSIKSGPSDGHSVNGSWSAYSSDQDGGDRTSDEDREHPEFPGLPVLTPEMYTRGRSPPQAVQNGNRTSPEVATSTTYRTSAPDSNGAGRVVFDAWSYHMRRLKEYGLEEVEMKGDGNCQFRAVADQIYGDQTRHVEVRNAVVKQLKGYAKRYRSHVESKYEDYVKLIEVSGTWGDHVTLQAIADKLKVRIQIATPVMENGMLEIFPYKGKAKHRMPTLWLSFWPEVHYNSLHPLQRPPAVKKRSPYLELPLPHKSDELLAGYRVEKAYESGSDADDEDQHHPPPLPPQQASKSWYNAVPRALRTKKPKSEPGNLILDDSDSDGRTQGPRKSKTKWISSAATKATTGLKKIQYKVSGEDRKPPPQGRNGKASNGTKEERALETLGAMMDQWIPSLVDDTEDKGKQNGKKSATKNEKSQWNDPGAPSSGSDSEGWSDFKEKWRRTNSNNTPKYGKKLYDKMFGNRSN